MRRTRKESRKGIKNKEEEKRKGKGRERKKKRVLLVFFVWLNDFFFLSLFLFGEDGRKRKGVPWWSASLGPRG